MSLEYRVARIESDMGHVRSTLADVKDEVKSLRGEVQHVRTELQSFKADVAMADANRELAKIFGSIRAEFEKIHTSIRQAEVWLMVLTVAAFGSLVGQVLELLIQAHSH